MKLQNLNKRYVDAGGHSNPSSYQSQSPHEREVPTETNNGNVMRASLLERQESSDSQRTEVQANELKLDGVSTSSGSAATSAASCGPHTHTLVLKNPVRQEVGDGTTTDEQSGPELDTSEDEVTFQSPENYRGRNEEAPSIMNGVPAQSPTDDAYISPTAAMDMTTDTSQLCMENQPPLNLQASHLSNNQSSSPVGLPTTETADRACQSDLDAPVEHEDRSNGFMYGVQHSGAACLPLLPGDIKVKSQQTADKMNTIDFRQRTVEVAGGTMWNEEAGTQQHSIDRYM